MTRPIPLFAALAILALATPAFAQTAPLRTDASAPALHTGDQDQDSADPLRKSDADVAFPIRRADPGERLSPDYSVSHSSAPMPQQANQPAAAPPAQANATADLNRQQAMQTGAPVPPKVAASGPPQPLTPQPPRPRAVVVAQPASAPATAFVPPQHEEERETVIVRAHNSAYLLATGDKVRVTVFGEDDLSGEFQVDGSGFISLPLIGQLTASGLSTDQLADAITVQLKEGYLNQPRVSVAISAYRPFYIIGQVNKPGEYPYVNDMTVLNAVALAGGYTDAANESTVYVRAKDEAAERAVVADSTTEIHPGDVVRVQKSTFWAVAQAVAPIANLTGLAYVLSH